MYTILDLIWKQDLMIKPYILFLLSSFDVYFNTLVFILKMQQSNNAPCHTYSKSHQRDLL